MKQILALIRQNAFFSAVSIIGTAVSILLTDTATASRMVEIPNTGTSYRAMNAIFQELPGAELVAYMGPTNILYCGPSPQEGMRRTVRQVDLNFWRIYHIPLVAGRLFSAEEFDACRDVVVIAQYQFE